MMYAIVIVLIAFIAELVFVGFIILTEGGDEA